MENSEPTMGPAESTQSSEQARNAFLEGLSDDFALLRENIDEWNAEQAERQEWDI